MIKINTEQFEKLKQEVCPMQNDMISFGYLDFEMNDYKVFFYLLANLNRLELIDINEKHKGNSELLEKEYEKLTLKPVRITLKNIVNDLGFGKNYDYVKNSIRKIARSAITITKPNERELNIPLIQKGDYNPNNDGYIEVKFNQELKPYLLPLGYFTESNLLPLITFTGSKYFPSLYNYIKMQRCLTKKNEITLDMNNLAVIFGLSNSYKNDFYEIKRRILDKALKDFKNEHCDISIESFETIRVGRKVGKVKFNTKSNKKFKANKKSLDKKSDNKTNNITDTTSQAEEKPKNIEKNEVTTMCW